MDELIDELIELYDGYHESKALLKECVNDYADDDYACQPYRQNCDELKDKIKATIKKIVDINKGEENE